MTTHDTVTGLIPTPQVIGFQFPNSSGDAEASCVRDAIIVIGAGATVRMTSARAMSGRIFYQIEDGVTFFPGKNNNYPDTRLCTHEKNASALSTFSTS